MSLTLAVAKSSLGCCRYRRCTLSFWSCGSFVGLSTCCPTLRTKTDWRISPLSTAFSGKSQESRQSFSLSLSAAKHPTIRCFSKLFGGNELSSARKVSWDDCGEQRLPRRRSMLSSSLSSGFLYDAQLLRLAKTQVSEHSPTKRLIDILFCFSSTGHRKSSQPHSPVTRWKLQQNKTFRLTATRFKNSQ